MLRRRVLAELAAVRRASNEATPPPEPIPPHARVVIVGGGVIGCSVAYSLSKLGWKDIVLLEQNKLTSGTTWHAAGLIGTSRGTMAETKLCVEGTKIFSRLKDETGYDAGYRKCGSVTLARNADRVTALKRNLSKTRGFGLDAEWLSPEEAQEKWPLMQVDDLHGALWLPGDGTASPTDVAMALIAGAKSRGVKVIEGARVLGFTSRNGRVTGVRTDQGVTTAEVVVNSCGQWARDIARPAGVTVPLHSAEHFYIITKAMEGAHRELPIMRDPDGYTYYREWSGGLCMGGFEPKCKPIFTKGIPSDFAFGLLPDDWEHFDVLLQEAFFRVPKLQSTEIRQMINGPESFTPDMQYIIGEAPGLRNYFVAAGFNSSGIASSGGAGKALAEWIDGGEPSMDLWATDIRRFGSFQGNLAYLRERTTETLGLHYAMPWPLREFESARCIRASPLYGTFSDAGAVWGQKFGWERANWFARTPSGPVKQTPEMTRNATFGKPQWFDYVRRECLNTRQNVSLFDQTSFAKLAVEGPDAEKFMQRICGANMALRDGGVRYTGMFNKRGGYETDCTVSRLSDESYMVISPTAQAVRDTHWMQSQIRDDRVTVRDVTSATCVLGVMGPKSRKLLAKVSHSDFDAFPFSTHRTVDIGNIQVRAVRMTYVGELGWELYVPVESTVKVFEALRCAGKEFGLELGGYYAIESLRMEKAYRAWGHELSPDVTPLEADLMFAVDMSKKDFTGKEAILRQRDQGLTKRLVVLTINTRRADKAGDASNPGAMLWGSEAILRNGEVVGFVSSAAYGHTVGQWVCMGYVKHPRASDDKFYEEGRYEIDAAGVRFPAVASLRPAFDPTSARVRDAKKKAA